MDRRLSRRIEKIERRLKPEKGEWLKFPYPDGSFIEVPGCESIADVLAVVGIGSHRQKTDETERN